VPVGIRCDTVASRPYAPAVRSDCSRLIRAEGLTAGELSIVLTGDGAIRKLNREFRGIDRATDVLSFPQFDDAGDAAANAAARLPIGDVVISIDTAIRQADRIGVEPADRIRTLLIHGFLHLLGYDHERSTAEARRMFARERELAALLTGVRRANGTATSGGSRGSRSRKVAARR
jgi:probable rRNA maturation factor